MDRMLEYIRKLPDEIEEGLNFPIPDVSFDGIDSVVFTGMGGSAIAGDLVKTLLSEDGEIRFETVRDYHLPPYADEGTLVIAISYSGNTEETLSATHDALNRKTRLIAITSGGKLEELAISENFPLIKIPSGLPPRAALGWLFTPLLRIFVPLKGAKVYIDALKSLPSFLRKLREEMEDLDSLARDLADKFYLRIPVIYSSTRLSAVAMRWKTQINENSKAFAHTALLPELDHNEISGIKNPEERIEILWLVFLKDKEDEERVKLRMEYTAEILRDSVMGISFIEPVGENFLERIFYFIFLGDYVSFYLAQNYGEDSVAIPRIDELKRRLAE
jgi:glucose/mannose-6-phosphate isomerase